MCSKIYKESKLRFDFTKSQSAIKADKKTYSGLLSVDFIVETESKSIFIEVKNISRGNKSQQEKWMEDLSISKQNYFLFRMGVKFKDTILKKWAMDEDCNKKIHYIVILKFDEFDASQRQKLCENFHTHLPICLKEKPFKRTVVLEKWGIYNIEQWNKQYSEFPIEILA